MYIFHDINFQWLPRVSLLVLAYTFTALKLVENSVIFLLLTTLLFAVVILYGLCIALQDSQVSFRIFFRRPANLLTLIRSLCVMGGLACGVLWLHSRSGITGWSSVILMIWGYMADAIDGWLARHEKLKSAAAQWGPWYDRETDSILLCLSCVSVVLFEDVPLYYILPGISRYVFALIFQFFPVEFVPSRWFYWYSKTVAAIFQTVTVFLWCSLLLSGDSAVFNKFLAVQIKFFLPATLLFVFSSFLIETIYRIRSFLSIIPPGYWAGIYRSFIIYFHIPLRYARMKAFYAQFIHPSDMAFDVGAHLGSRTRLFLALGARVVSFEPQPACRGLLENWFGDHEGVQLEFIALGAVERRTEMLVSKRNPTLASTDQSWVREMGERSEFQGIEWDGRQQTDMKTLDMMIAAYGKPGFIKIDTEGNEREILSGLSAAVDCVSFEFTPSQKDRAKECIEKLMHLGKYCFNFSLGESMKMRLTTFISDTAMKTRIDSWPAKGKSGDIYAICQKSD